MDEDLIKTQQQIQGFKKIIMYYQQQNHFYVMMNQIHFTCNLVIIVMQFYPKPNKNHNKFIFYFGQDKHKLQFTSEFDSGNLSSVQQITSTIYKITASTDIQASKAKSFFHFSVSGFEIGMRINFIISNIDILSNYYRRQSQQQIKTQNLYQVCMKKGERDWQRMLQATNLYMNKDNNLQISFSYTFWQETKFSFAFCYPYPYQRYIDCIDMIILQYSNHPEIYLNVETLIYSNQCRPVKMITISNYRDISQVQQQYIERLFPDRLKESRSLKYKYNKPCILITGRVHPGETPSSFVAEGILNFLLNKQDLRSYLLRQLFVFIIIPMLNPDGVYAGNFRYDNYNQNLNRFYRTATKQKQPSIFAVKKIIKKLADEHRLMYYFDLHSHHSPRGCFIYGNAFQEFSHQVESKIFCKLMALNCPDFEYEICNFSQKHMNLKDKYDKYSKEGCGRVYAYRQTGMIHSYTIQCGYYRAKSNISIVKQANEDFQYEGFSLTQSQNQVQNIFRTHNYREIGRSLLISILDSLQLNPYSRIQNSSYKNMIALRKAISLQVFQQQQRFRRSQVNIQKQIKNIKGEIDKIYEQITKNLKLNLKHVSWPLCFRKNRFQNLKLNEKILHSIEQKTSQQLTVLQSESYEQQQIEDSSQDSPNISKIKASKKSIKRKIKTEIHEQTSNGVDMQNQKFDQNFAKSKGIIKLTISIKKIMQKNRNLRQTESHIKLKTQSKLLMTKQFKNEKKSNSQTSLIAKRQFKKDQSIQKIIPQVGSQRKFSDRIKNNLKTKQFQFQIKNNLTIKFPKIQHLNSIKTQILKQMKKNSNITNPNPYD